MLSITTLSGYQAGRTMQAAPGTSAVLPAAQGMRVERDGRQRWLVVNEPPEKLWPLLRSFWEETGFKLPLEDARLGIMETEWNENRGKLPQDFIRRTVGKYLDNLIEAYDHFFYHYKESALLIVDTSQIDFVEDEGDLKALQRRITGGNGHGIQYYHPIRKRKN